MIYAELTCPECDQKCQGTRGLGKHRSAAHDVHGKEYKPVSVPVPVSPATIEQFTAALELLAVSYKKLQLDLEVANLLVKQWETTAGKLLTDIESLVRREE